MSKLIVTPKRSQFVSLPHYLLIDGKMIGLFKEQVSIHLPAGYHSVTLRSTFRFVENTVALSVGINECVILNYSDRERWWNILFNIDVLLWLIKRFSTFGEPWDTVYEVLSNGFFVIWMLRIWLIRKNYFQFTIKRASV